MAGVEFGKCPKCGRKYRITLLPQMSGVARVIPHPTRSGCNTFQRDLVPAYTTPKGFLHRCKGVPMVVKEAPL